MNWQRLTGRFLVLDGPDGAGKSTQARLLQDDLRQKGLDTLLLRDPGATPIGEQIRGILLDHQNKEMGVRCEALLYMASRAQLYEQAIKPALARGCCVLCDRWVSSTYAYQAVAGKIGPDYVLQLADAALERTWPDLTLIIDLPSDIGLQRAAQRAAAPAPSDVSLDNTNTSKPLDRIEQRPGAYHQRVRQAFLHLAQSREDFCVIDGGGSVDDVHRRVHEAIQHYVTA